MYGQAGVAAGATSTAAGIASLPATGGNTPLMIVSLAAIIIGAVAVTAQLAVMAYRRRALRQL
jgi:uncharacterized integral membrane protein